MGEQILNLFNNLTEDEVSNIVKAIKTSNIQKGDVDESNSR